MAETKSKAAPEDAVAEDKPATPARTPKAGDILLVTVEPGSNNGHDAAPALVTSVDGDGLVHALVFREGWAPPQLLGGLAVFPDRAAVDELDEHDDPAVRATRPAYAAYYA
jgi:hypothetical protein